MSFWAAVVITNLISVLPYIGPDLVEWLWGGFGVGQATLSRFYSLHFVLPFVMCLLVIIHVYFLHDVGSRNPVNLNDGGKSVEYTFHPLYISSDIFICRVAFLLIIKYRFLTN